MNECKTNGDKTPIVSAKRLQTIFKFNFKNSIGFSCLTDLIGSFSQTKKFH